MNDLKIKYEDDNSEDVEVLAAQEHVLRLGKSLYALLAGVDVGIAESALEVAAVFKRRENQIFRQRRSAQILGSRGLSNDK